MKIKKNPLIFPKFMNKKLSQICPHKNTLYTLYSKTNKKSRIYALFKRRNENYNFINNITNNILSNKVPKDVSSYKIKTQTKLFDHGFSFTKIVYPCDDTSYSQEASEINKKEIKNYPKRPKSNYNKFKKCRKKLLEQQTENSKNIIYKPIFENYIMQNRIKKQNETINKIYINKTDNRETEFNDSLNHKNEFTYNFIKDTKNIHYILSPSHNQIRPNLYRNNFLLLSNKKFNSKKDRIIFKTNKTIQNSSKNKNKNNNSSNIFNKKERYSKTICNELHNDDKKLARKLLNSPESFLYQIYHNTLPTNIVPEIYLSKKTMKEKFNYFKKDLQELENETYKEVSNLKKQLAVANKSNSRGNAKSSKCFLDLAFGQI